MPKKILIGKVVSTKMDKTGVAVVESHPAHPLYKKVQTKRNRLKFHDEKEACKEGDLVRLIECRPLSKDKHFRLLEIIESAT